MVMETTAQSPSAEDQLPSLFQGVDELVETPAPSAPEAAVPNAEPATASETVTFDLSSPELVKQAVEQSESLRTYLANERKRAELDTENTVKQRLEAQARRERGTVESVTAWQRHLAEKYGIELDEADSKEAPLFVKANADALRVQIAKSYLDGHIQQFGLPEQEAITTAMSAIEDNPDAMEQLASQVAIAVHNKGKTDALAELDPESLKDNPRFTDYINAQVKARLEEEMNAKNVEAGIRPNAPQVPTGVATSSGIDPVEFSQMSESAQAAWLESHSEQEVDALTTALYEAARAGS